MLNLISVKCAKKNHYYLEHLIAFALAFIHLNEWMSILIYAKYWNDEKYQHINTFLFKWSFCFTWLLHRFKTLVAVATVVDLFCMRRHFRWIQNIKNISNVLLNENFGKWNTFKPFASLVKNKCYTFFFINMHRLYFYWIFITTNLRFPQKISTNKTIFL